MSDMNSRTIEDLSPIDTVELSTYDKNILDQIFDPANDRIKNIAITGPYASGKSSYIESYKKARLDNEDRPLRFLHISLAHFGEADTENAITNYSIEKKIVNQLIHTLPRKTREKAAKQLNGTIVDDQNQKNLFLFVWELLWIFITILFFSNTTFVKTLFSLSQKWITIAAILIGFFFLLSVVHILYRILSEKTFHFQLKSLNIGISEIEAKEHSGDSYFDNHLEEVLYIFEKCDADVFVFEDIDRFNMSSIFERLREINTLLNKRINSNSSLGDFMYDDYASTDHTPHNVIKFTYLIKDDIFDCLDRQKFFDYIIPIMPQLSINNVLDKVMARTDIVMPEKDSEDWLAWNRLGLYIRNMRMLINVCNEYNTFNHRLAKDEHFKDYKLMAMILYKNYYPDDFSRLYANEGFIYEILNSKHRDAGITIADLMNQGKLIIDTNNHPDKEYLENVQKSKYYKMLEMFLRYGYIEDDYLNYISNSSEDMRSEDPALLSGSTNTQESPLIQGDGEDINPSAKASNEKNLSSTDMRYYQSVLERNGITISSPISNPERILQRLKPEDMGCREALNLSMLEYLLDHDQLDYLDYMTGYAEDNLEIFFLENACKRFGNKKDFILMLHIEDLIKKAKKHQLMYIVSPRFEESIRILQLYDTAYREKSVYKTKDYQHITLRDSNLDYANLSGLNLSDSLFVHCSLSPANLSCTDFSSSTFMDCAFYNANLSHAKLETASLDDCILNDANITSAKFNKAKLSKISFIRATCNSSDFIESRLYDVVMDEADLTYANFNRAILSNVDISLALNVDKTYGLNE